MAYNTAKMLTDADGKLIPQMYDPVTDTYKPLTPDAYNNVDIASVPENQTVVDSQAHTRLDAIEAALGGTLNTQLTGSTVAVDNTGAIVDNNVAEYRGLSTDTKPTTNVPLYSVFIEMDTGNDFYWNGTVWNPGAV